MPGWVSWTGRGCGWLPGIFRLILVRAGSASWHAAPMGRARQAWRGELGRYPLRVRHADLSCDVTRRRDDGRLTDDQLAAWCNCVQWISSLPIVFAPRYAVSVSSSAMAAAERGLATDELDQAARPVQPGRGRTGSYKIFSPTAISAAPNDG